MKLTSLTSSTNYNENGVVVFKTMSVEIQDCPPKKEADPLVVHQQPDHLSLPNTNTLKVL